MKPDVERTLQLLARSLLLELGPGLPHDYARKSALLAAMLLSSTAEEWDRAAERRAEENRALRELFAAAERGVADAVLRERLAAAARTADTSLRVSELERTNAGLRALLVELHAYVEELATPDAREIEARIWDELRRSTERRRLSMQPF